MKQILFLLCIFFAFHTTFAQYDEEKEAIDLSSDEQGFVEPNAQIVELREYDAKKLAEYRKEKRFQYEKNKKKAENSPNWFDKLMERFGKWLISVSPSAKTFDKMGNIFVYGIAILALGLIVWGIFKMRIRTAIAKTAEPLNLDFKEVENNIMETDFEKYLREAVATGNYKRAVQMLYLESLKTLTLNNVIQWKPNKTNQEYLYELQGSPLRRPFMDITRLFEYIFYGEFPINEQTYSQTASAFQDFQGQIGRKK